MNLPKMLEDYRKAVVYGYPIYWAVQSLISFAILIFVVLQEASLFVQIIVVIITIWSQHNLKLAERNKP